LTYKLDDQDFIYCNVPDGQFLLSLCDECSSILLVNPEDRTERIVLSVEGRIEKCEHKWESAVHAWSFEPVEPGDVLFIIYKGEMYALMLEKIFGNLFPNQKISYKIAKIAESGRFPTNVKWRELTWQKREAEEEIPIADRKISFFADSVVMDGGRNIKKFVSIGYDNYYGGYSGTPDAGKYETPAHIAIVHRSYLEDNPVVDLTKFRFKTWEDGLGNLVDTNEPQ
jgi:hypothetical protein